MCFMNKIRTSLLLRKVIEGIDGDTVTVRQLTKALGYRALGLLIFIFAIPNIFIVMLIPGSSLILGVFLIFLSLQLVLRCQKIFLPKVILEKKVLKNTLIHILEKTRPYLEKIENSLKPRMEFLDKPFFQSILGCVCVLLSVIIAMPLFLSNFLPGIALTLIGIGLIERDGLVILIGVAFGIVSSFLVLAMWTTLFNGAFHFLS